MAKWGHWRQLDNEGAVSEYVMKVPARRCDVAKTGESHCLVGDSYMMEVAANEQGGQQYYGRGGGVA